MLPNFWLRAGKFEEGDVSISYLDFGQEQEKFRKGGVHMMPNFWSRTGNIEEESISYQTFGQEQEKLRNTRLDVKF